MGHRPQGGSGRIQLAKHGAAVGNILAVDDVGIPLAVAREVPGRQAGDAGQTPHRVARKIQFGVSVDAASDATAVDQNAPVRRKLEMLGGSDALAVEPVPTHTAVRIESLHPGNEPVRPHSQTEHIDDAVPIHQAAPRARSVEVAVIHHPPQQVAGGGEFHQDAGRGHRVGETGLQRATDDNIARRIAGDPDGLFPLCRVRLVVATCHCSTPLLLCLMSWMSPAGFAS